MRGRHNVVVISSSMQIVKEASRLYNGSTRFRGQGLGRRFLELGQLVAVTFIPIIGTVPAQCSCFASCEAPLNMKAAALTV